VTSLRLTSADTKQARRGASYVGLRMLMYFIVLDVCQIGQLLLTANEARELGWCLPAGPSESVVRIVLTHE
jgi:hypothetical protein